MHNRTSVLTVALFVAAAYVSPAAAQTRTPQTAQQAGYTQPSQPVSAPASASSSPWNASVPAYVCEVMLLQETAEGGPASLRVVFANHPACQGGVLFEGKIYGAGTGPSWIDPGWWATWSDRYTFTERQIEQLHESLRAAAVVGQSVVAWVRWPGGTQTPSDSVVFRVGFRAD